MTTLGPNFGNELITALGPNPPLTWTPGGDETSIEWAKPPTDQQLATLAAVVAAHDPLTQPNPADQIDVIQFKIALNHENRIRALEQKPAITAAQFKNALRALLS